MMLTDNLQRWLNDAFSELPISGQPTTLVVLGALNESTESLEELCTYIEQHTARGHQLSQYPLTVLSNLWKESTSLPQGIAASSIEVAPTSLRNIQTSQNIDIEHHGLAIMLGEGTHCLPWLSAEFIALFPTHGIFISLCNVNQKMLYGWVTDLAEQGVLPQADAFHYNGSTTQALDAHLKPSPMQIRPASMDDLDTLLELETLCWADGQRMSKALLTQRLQQFPSGQHVLVANERVAGVVYSQRIQSDQTLERISAFDVQGLHHDQGTVLQLLALNVYPSEQHHGYGDLLLEYLLQLSTCIEGIKRVVGVTRCKDYAKHAQIPLTEYIHHRNHQSRLSDTVLRFHELHGARIERLVHGYRPADTENQGCGVLVSYDPFNRSRNVIETPNATDVRGVETASSNDVIKHIKAAAALTDEEALDLHQPLFELGIDSAALLDLSERLQTTFAKRFPPAYFFEHNTTDKIIRQLGTERVSSRSSASQQAQEPADREPHANDIAIIGMACLLPGDVNHYQTFWAHIEQGVTAVGPMTEQRWLWPDTVNPAQYQGINLGGFVRGIDQFDATFFRISPREAALMDPQQRLLLEYSWACVEDAGYSPTSLRGSRTGVFVGASGSDYQLRQVEQQTDVDAHFSLSTSNAVIANRLSYFFDWCGPSLTIDTACSSSLVALVDAVNSIRSNQCDQALVAGVHLMCHPSNSIAYHKAGMLADDGRCKTFDESANGYVRSEGLVILLIKPLKQAKTDGDHIHAVIKGIAANHGGQAAGLTVPNPVQQAALITSALHDAKVNANTISYVEAHGTGTPLGDPIEVEGLKRAFQEVSDDHRCGLGSVKTHIGHLEAAAGLAGLLKVVLCLQHERLPGILNFQRLNPKIDLEHTPFYIVDQHRDWVSSDTLSPLRAGISSFGSGGTNAHAIIERYPAVQRPSQAQHRPALIVLSARSDGQLKQQLGKLLEHIKTHRHIPLADLEYTLQVGRDPMPIRWGCYANDLNELIQHLEHALSTPSSSAILVEHPNENTPLSDWLSGNTVDWNTLPRDHNPQRLPLPTYPFAHQSFWKLDPPLNAIEEPMPTETQTVSSSKPDNIKLSPLQEPVCAPALLEKPNNVRLSALNTAPSVPPEEPVAPVSIPPDTQVTEVLIEQLAQVLYLDPDDIDPDESFTYLGMDSISGVEWMRAINRHLSLSLSAPTLYSYPSINKLAAHIQGLRVNTVTGQDKTAPAPAPAPAPARQTPEVEPPQSHALNHVFNTLQESLADVLYLDAAEIDPEEPFNYLGLDSISGVEWVRAINRQLGLSITATTIYSYPCIEQLAKHLAGTLPLTKPVIEATAQAPVSEPPPPRAERSNTQPPPQRVAVTTNEHHDADSRIAIIGMSGRYPEAPNLQAFWNNLAAGRHSVKEISPDRWSLERYYDPHPFQPGKTNSKWLGMLEDLDAFDATFFGITANEARQMDPQQRLFLQEAYHAIEDAGYAPESLANSRCGVYLGVSNNEYATLLRQSALGAADRIGNNLGIAAARIAYHLDLKGPALAVDTACSSSLVALHLACQALRAKEIDLAITGGTCTYLTPELYVGMATSGMLATDGRCKAFDDQADGIVPGEGVGALCLKRLADAETDGDPILGVIIASGTNQDGRTNGITAPNGLSQAQLIKDVYDRFQISADSVDYVETHGTGTRLGDPIELEALSHAFGEPTTSMPWLLGSVKTNVGHTSAAAGVAGVHKVLLSLQHQQLPPSLHFERANTHFDFEAKGFKVNTVLQPWQAREQHARRAAISSFGISGTNAHVVIEEYPRHASANNTTDPVVFVCSAHTQDRLQDNLMALKAAIANETHHSLEDICYTLQTGRDPKACRVAIVASSREELLHAIDRVIDGKPGSNAFINTGINQELSSLLGPEDLHVLLNQWLAQHDLKKIAKLWANGIAINWHVLYGEHTPRRCSLPGYCFDPQRYWVPDSPSAELKEEPAQRATTTPATTTSSTECTTAELGQAIQATPGNPAERHPQPLHDVMARCNQRLIEDPNELHRLVSSTGIQRIHLGPKEALVRIQGNSEIVGDARLAHYLGLALECINALSSTSFHTDHLEQCITWGALPEHAWIWIQEHVDASRSLTICDDQAMPCASAQASTREQRDAPINVLHTITAIAKRVLDLEQLNVNYTIGEYGFDSIQFARLASAMNESLGTALTPVSFFEHPTLQQLSEHVKATGYQQLQPTPIETPPSNAPLASPMNGEWETPEDAIAIIGISACFPQADSLEAFWRNLEQEKDCITEVPDHRWRWQDYWGDPNQSPFKTRIKWAGFAERLTQFDPLFFGISPRDAELMDVQQRALLTFVWQALEDAGYAPQSLAGSQTAVLLGTGGGGFGRRVEHAGGHAEATGMLGLIPSIGPNRISHLLDLHGPSEPVETSCSSSLVAIHRAVSLLKSGECDLAISGGVNVLATPEPFCTLNKAGMLSPTGKCKTFAEDADGYARGEGAGIVILKRLSDAERDGDHVYGVIRGSAENHGGKAQSLTAPNPNAQAALLRKAYERSGIDPASIGYLEAHGTGTALGDPIEIQAIRQAFAKHLPHMNCGIGSVKTNIGHLELASGVAGLMKVLLQLQHQTLVKSLHSDTLNPLINLNDTGLFVVQQTQPWPAPLDREGRELPRRAGISSFGFGGVNAHLIVEEYRARPTPSQHDSSHALVILSAKTSNALKARVSQLIVHLEASENAAISLHDLAYTLQVGRDAMRHRLALVVDSLPSLLTQLKGYLSGQTHGWTGQANTDAELPLKTHNGQGQQAPTEAALNDLAEHWVRGTLVDWATLYPTRPKRIPLPTYPFEGSNYLPPLTPSAVPSVLETTEDSAIRHCYQYHWEACTPEQVTTSVLPNARTLFIGDRTLLDTLPKTLSDVRHIDVTHLTSEALSPLLTSQKGVDHLIWVLPQTHVTKIDDERLITDQAFGVKAGLTLIQTLLASGYEDKPLRLTVVTNQSLAVHRNDTVDPTHAPMHGLIGTLAKEQPKWHINLFDVDRPETLNWQELLNIAPERRGRTYALRANQWHQQQLFPVDNWKLGTRSFRQHGVYVIIGGTGDVGGYLTDYLIRKYQATVIWLGRRPLNDEIQGQIDAIQHHGRSPVYLQADATDRQALEQARTQIIERYGQIHGLIHAAMVFSSNPLANMSSEQLSSVLSAKVDTSVRMAQVFQSDDLDVVLYFSSLITAIKNPKQAHYAAACAFKDAFAASMSAQWSCQVKIANWGYWYTPDLLVSEDYEQLKSLGIDFITADEGIAFIETLLNAPVQQLGFMKTNKPLPIEGVANQQQVSLPKAAPNRVDLATHCFDADTTQVNTLREALQSDKQQLDHLLCQYLCAQLGAMGLFNEPTGLPEEQTSRSGIGTQWAPWLEESLRALHASGWLSNQTHQPERIPSLEEAQRQWAEQAQRWANDPAMHSRVCLIQPLLEQLPEVLRGNTRATDLMFPDSSMDLVGNVYRYNRVASYFNEALAKAAATFVAQQHSATRLRILEIGAGTGGTTASVLPALKPLAQHIEAYCYTDISPAFLSHGEQTFAGEYPFLTFQRFDVTKPLQAQGLKLGQYDLVIAANVLHATPNIRQTLRNAKAHLKPGGVLLLNEISQNSLFMHLTFGLLDGWWQVDDASLRVEGSPALTPDMWGSVLEQEGFTQTRFATAAAHDLGQQIVLASSDGVVHQSTFSGKKRAPSSSVALPNDGGTSSIETTIVEHIHRLLKVPVDAIETDLPFAEFGVDSITGVTLINELNTHWSTSLEATALFDYATVKKLSAHISQAYPELNQTRQESSVEELADFSDAVPSNTNNQSQDPIAIIGISCRFAGSDNPDQLWEHLAQGDDLITSVNRWNLDQLEDELAGKTICRYGSFLDHIEHFDPMFFNISGVEARAMDPQQRLFLEEAWHALEDAGYSGEQLQGTSCGVYVGCMGGDYRELVEQNSPAQAMWGNSPAILPARIAYYLDLKGPAIAVDTACSSSLVAIHLACQSLRAGETRMALAGGVYVQCTPRFYFNANRASMLSPTGKCHAFDDQADGFVPGEGVGVVALKRLSDAIKDNDHIYGVIKGSGTNQDGATNGITAPSALSQEQLLRQVYQDFDINAEDIQMVEAHGTGTRLGDPIEYQALSKAFRQDTDQAHYCALGSIKTNIGHTTHAAGVAGVIKILLSMKHQKIPASLNYEQGNSNIRFEGSPFYVNTALQDWITSKKRLATVSSFGFSGTNAHLVIEQAPEQAPPISTPQPRLIAVSAKTATQLQAQLHRLAEHLTHHPEASLSNVSYTLLTGRDHFEHRWACVASNLPELLDHLHSVMDGDNSAPTSTEVADAAALTQWIEEWAATSDPATQRDCLHRIAQAYCQGAHVPFPSLFPDQTYRRTPLPTYPFAKEPYWIDEQHPGASNLPPQDHHVSLDDLLTRVLENQMDVNDAAAHITKMVSQ